MGYHSYICNVMRVITIQLSAEKGEWLHGFETEFALGLAPCSWPSGSSIVDLAL